MGQQSYNWNKKCQFLIQKMIVGKKTCMMVSGFIIQKKNPRREGTVIWRCTIRPKINPSKGMISYNNNSYSLFVCHTCTERKEIAVKAAVTTSAKEKPLDAFEANISWPVREKRLWSAAFQSQFSRTVYEARETECEESVPPSNPTDLFFDVKYSFIPEVSLCIFFIITNVSISNTMFHHRTFFEQTFQSVLEKTTIVTWSSPQTKQIDLRRQNVFI